jgi:hypothetical protein
MSKFLELINLHSHLSLIIAPLISGIVGAIIFKLKVLHGRAHFVIPVMFILSIISVTYMYYDPKQPYTWSRTLYTGILQGGLLSMVFHIMPGIAGYYVAMRVKKVKMESE